MSGILDFLKGCVRQVLQGGRGYKAWVAFLVATIVAGGVSYAQQARYGLIATSMRDEVSWAFYIGNFTFLVGVAAAAVLLVIPAYVYHWKPIKEVVVLGELLAISALVMCLLFILVDMGRPDRFLHIMPFLGTPNFPRSLLTWDALVLNGYLLVNVVLVSYLMVKTYRGEAYDKRIFLPLVVRLAPVGLHHEVRDEDHVHEQVAVQDERVPGEERAREVGRPEERHDVEEPVGPPHVHEDEEQAHDERADREQLAEDHDLLDRLPVVDVRGDDEQDRRRGDADEEGEVADVEGPGDLVAHVRHDEAAAGLLRVGEGADEDGREEERDPGLVGPPAAQHVPGAAAQELEGAGHERSSLR